MDFMTSKNGYKHFLNFHDKEKYDFEWDKFLKYMNNKSSQMI